MENHVIPTDKTRVVSFDKVKALSSPRYLRKLLATVYGNGLAETAEADGDDGPCPRCHGQVPVTLVQGR